MNNRTCDILIVGGGIAGIAIAERLAREACRQGKKADIVLIERDPQLAMRASSGLEGWFHTGSLYAKIQDGHSFITCLKSLEDMTNWYANDRLFPRRDSCAIEYTSGSGIRVVPCLDQSEQQDQWFEAPINFVIKSAPESVQWAQATQCVHHRLHHVFQSQSWVNANSSLCQMPLIDFDEPTIEFTKEVQETKEQEFQSADVTMNSRRVLQHLVESASGFGVEFLVNHTALLSSQSTHGEHCVAALNSATNERVAFRATQVVYTIGDQTVSRDVAGVRFDRIDSVMITRQPSMCQENTVVMCENHGDDINHVYHPDPTGGYSILADSNSLKLCDGQAESLPDVQLAAARAIYDKARAHFGEVVGDYSDWNMISCIKTEVLSHRDSPRFYSYWWGPEYASWKHPEWIARRQMNQYATQESIKKLVLDMDDMLPMSIKEDSWALKKAIHYALLKVSVRQDDASKNRFSSIQLSAHETANRFSTSSINTPIHVIPGKFSLFPSVAHNIYLEFEMRGHFLNLIQGHATARSLPCDIIAQPKAMRVHEHSKSALTNDVVTE